MRVQCPIVTHRCCSSQRAASPLRHLGDLRPCSCPACPCGLDSQPLHAQDQRQAQRQSQRGSLTSPPPPPPPRAAAAPHARAPHAADGGRGRGAGRRHDAAVGHGDGAPQRAHARLQAALVCDGARPGVGRPLGALALAAADGAGACLWMWPAACSCCTADGRQAPPRLGHGTTRSLLRATLCSRRAHAGPALASALASALHPPRRSSGRTGSQTGSWARAGRPRRRRWRSCGG